MDRVRFLTHRDQRVLLVDYTGCNPQQIAEIADQVPAIVTQEPTKSLLILADFTGAEFTRDAVERLKVATAIDKPHIKRAAWVVNSNLPKALLESIKTFSTRDFPTFATREEALDYLVSREQPNAKQPPQ
jgi:hypothetical protein